MRLSIKLKIIISYTLLFGLVLSCFALIIYQNIKQNELDRLDNNLKSYSTILQSEIEEQISDEKKINIEELKNIKAEGLQDVRISLFDKKNNAIIFDPIILDKKKWDEVKKEKRSFETFPLSSGITYRSFISLVEVNGDTPYVLQVACSMRDMEQTLKRLQFIPFLIIPLALLLAGLAAWYISNSAFKPVVKMAQMARDITANSLDKRLLLPNSKDEIYFLGATLNEMISRIDSYFKSQKQFVADASHEIRTPLTILRNELELMERAHKDSSDNESIKAALSEIDSLSKLTTSLLTLARLDTAQIDLKFNKISVDELIIECVQFMRNAADEKNITFNLNFDEQLLIEADEDKLKSVFINLIDNAVKYSVSNSVICIEIKKVAEQGAQITVQNFGTLIHPFELEKIFQRFYRSNDVQSKTKGNGLGLSIAREFVEMHKGSLSAESSLEFGTIFNVLLPITSSP